MSDLTPALFRAVAAFEKANRMLSAEAVSKCQT
jgi:hypothetical protein